MQRTAMVVFAAMCVMVAALTAQSGRALSIRDLLTAVRVADPQLSPDGRTVAYVRTTTDIVSGKRNADVWSVPVDGGAPKALITGETSEDTPRWSPDSRHIAFVSARDGDPQVYVADASGASPRQLTRVSGGVQAPMVWSPDGKLLAFIADVYPDC